MSTGVIVLIVAVVVIAIVVVALVLRSRKRRQSHHLGLPPLGSLSTNGLDNEHATQHHSTPEARS